MNRLKEKIEQRRTTVGTFWFVVFSIFEWVALAVAVGVVVGAMIGISRGCSFGG